MCLGAAGCGYEYSNPNHKCGFLNGVSSLFGQEFNCLKYSVELKKDSRSGHPLRCKLCSDDAWKDAESKLALEKLRQTMMSRNNSEVLITTQQAGLHNLPALE